VLIARIYEVFPLLCPMCGAQMRLIAFITEGAQIRKILDHISVACAAQRTSLCRKVHFGGGPACCGKGKGFYAQ
jgi:hypothetical protein